MLKKIFTCRYIYHDMQCTFCKSSSTFKGKKRKKKIYIYKSITKYIKTIVEFFVKITNQVFAKHKTPRFSVKLIDKTKR